MKRIISLLTIVLIVIPFGLFASQYKTVFTKEEKTIVYPMPFESAEEDAICTLPKKIPIQILEEKIVKFNLWYKINVVLNNRKYTGWVKKINLATMAELEELKQKRQAEKLEIENLEAKTKSTGKFYPYSFRKTKWGMSKQEVIKSESLKPFKKGKNTIIYKSKVLGKNVYIAYIFVQNKLVRTKYMLTERHTNKNMFIDDYNDFKNILINKYGQCIKDDVIWREDLYKDDPKHWGMAISMGHLLYFSKWETDITVIGCIITGDNLEITCGVEYSSKELEKLEKKEREKKSISNF